MRPDSVTQSTLLPDRAFLPRRVLAKKELQAFTDRRNRLWSLCGPEERRCLLQVADWYASHDPQLLRRPNAFSESAQATLYHRLLHPMHAPQPDALTRSLASIQDVISRIERVRHQRHRAALVARLAARAEDAGADVMLGVVHFLRLLPLHIGLEQQAFEIDLDRLTATLVADGRVGAFARFEAVRQCIPWGAAISDSMHSETFALPKHLWQLLLAVAEEDMDAALRLVDEYGSGRKPAALDTFHLQPAPELAYRLAVKLKPHRPEYAIDLLTESISTASRQLPELEAADASALQRIVDASCRLLADWAFELMDAGAWSPLGASQTLFRYSDPGDEPWQQLPARCMPFLRALPAADLHRRLLIVAQLAHYGPPPLAQEALEMFKAGVASGLEASADVNRDAVKQVCRALSILDASTFSHGNRRIPPAPDHPLLHEARRQFDTLRTRLLAGDAPQGLSKLVSLTLALSNESLFRQHHRILRDEFARHAPRHTDDAGLALQKLVQYCGYSQVDDEMYRKTLCRETFDALLPLLEAVSPADAAVARSGIGWNPSPWGRRRRSPPGAA